MPEKSAAEGQLARVLGHRLRTVRLDRGLSQEKVAQDAGISRNQYQLLEAGLSDRAKARPVNPRLNTLIGVARALGVSTSELVARILDEHPNAARSAAGNLATSSSADHARRQQPAPREQSVRGQQPAPRAQPAHRTQPAHRGRSTRTKPDQTP